MNISRNDLYRIVLEEYAREEGLDEDKVDDLLAHIRGGRKPDWMDDDPQETPSPPEVPAPEGSETYPMEKPPHPEMSHDELAATIGELIHGKDPEEVSEIFQLAFEKLPGVELSKPGDEDPPQAGGTEYGGEEYERRQKQMPIGFEESFQLEEMMSLIREVLFEGNYRDMEDEGEIYDIRDAGVTSLPLVQRIQNSYHELQDAFDDLEGVEAQEIARRIISDLETLMDTEQYPQDYRE